MSATCHKPPVMNDSETDEIYEFIQDRLPRLPDVLIGKLSIFYHNLRMEIAESFEGTVDDHRGWLTVMHEGRTAENGLKSISENFSTSTKST